MNLIFGFLIAFFLTVLIESAVLFIFNKSAFNSVKISFILNSLTHPIFWGLMSFIFIYNFAAFLFFELVVFFVEGLLLYKIFHFSVRKALILSFCMNFISAVIGVFL